jgi:hypothetical protein
MEPHIVLNGTELSSAQSIAIRVAIESFWSTLDDPDYLGADEHGRKMVSLYRERLNEVRKLIYP